MNGGEDEKVDDGLPPRTVSLTEDDMEAAAGAAGGEVLRETFRVDVVHLMGNMPLLGREDPAWKRWGWPGWGKPQDKKWMDEDFLTLEGRDGKPISFGLVITQMVQDNYNSHHLVRADSDIEVFFYLSSRKEKNSTVRGGLWLSETEAAHQPFSPYPFRTTGERIAYISVRESTIHYNVNTPEGSLMSFSDESLYGRVEVTYNNEKIKEINSKGEREETRGLQVRDLVDAFHDFHLTSDGSKISCHRVVLATRSRVFRSMFVAGKQKWLASEAQVEGLSKDALKIFVDCLYDREQWSSNICQEKAIQLLPAAHRYGLVDLKQRCGVVLRTTLTTKTALELWKMASLYSCSKLKEEALQCLADEGKEEEWEKNSLRKKLAL